MTLDLYVGLFFTPEPMWGIHSTEGVNTYTFLKTIQTILIPLFGGIGMFLKEAGKLQPEMFTLQKDPSGFCFVTYILRYIMRSRNASWNGYTISPSYRSPRITQSQTRPFQFQDTT